LVSIGIILSQIGLRSQGSAEREFLTFGQPFMYGGIPMISVLGGLIAIPLIMQYMNWQEEISYTYKSKEKKDINFPVWSSIRGGLIGLFTGLLPAIGTQIGSNLAWRIEKIFYSKNNDKSVLSRLTSAESANNGSQITVLVPLLILGIAIVPSEMILLSIIDTKSWIPGQSSWTLLGFGFYPWLMITLIMSSFICYLVCSVFVNLISKWLKDKPYLFFMLGTWLRQKRFLCCLF
jgi:TctA family transporter